jgi:hypothetical protein
LVAGIDGSTEEKTSDDDLVAANLSFPTAVSLAVKPSSSSTTTTSVCSEED